MKNNIIKGKNFYLKIYIITYFLITNSLISYGREPALSTAKEFLDTGGGMTLWELIKTGGFIMIILGCLSIVALASIIYNFLTLKKEKLAPEEFSNRVIQDLKLERFDAVRLLCQTHNNLIAQVTKVGLERYSYGGRACREAMESAGKDLVNRVRQRINLLADIATISPMVGLLGTVVGMIQAFNVIAFQTAVVKPIMLAGGISKAMVTTAGGLIIAIPAMIFHSFFKFKLHSILSLSERYVYDIISILAKEGQDKIGVDRNIQRDS